jgi:hypothetical protein
MTVHDIEMKPIGSSSFHQKAFFADFRVIPSQHRRSDDIWFSVHGLQFTVYGLLFAACGEP